MHKIIIPIPDNLVDSTLHLLQLVPFDASVQTEVKAQLLESHRGALLIHIHAEGLAKQQKQAKI